MHVILYLIYLCLSYCFFSFFFKFKRAHSIFSRVHRIKGDLFFICETARVPAVTNLPYNNNAKVEAPVPSCRITRF